MSAAMKEDMIKDLENALIYLRKYPEETYSFMWDHEWIDDIMGEKIVDFRKALRDPKLALPEMKFKDLEPIIVAILNKTKESDPNDEWIGDTYISPDWCSISNFLNTREDDDFVY